MTSIYESLVWDSLDLSTGATYALESLSIPPAPKKPQWLPGADADGELLVRDPKFGNRTVSVQVRILKQASKDLALAAIGALVDKCEECERQDAGLALVWTPANSTKVLTLYVASAEIPDVPITIDGDLAGWFQETPVLTINFSCRPFLYAAEVLSSTASASTPAVTTTLASIAGEVAAEGRLIVTDLATQSRRWLEWGIQNRYYDAATSLEVESDNMVTTGFAGTQTTRTGAYDPGAVGNNVIRATLATSPTAVCGTGNLGHVGVFRVIGRVYSVPASGVPSDVKVRLSWQDGDGSFRANPFTSSPVINAFGRVDLGLVTISEKKAGTQKWSGRIEAYSAAAGDTIDVDVLFLVPALEGYGRAGAGYSYSAGALAGRDEFTGIGAATVLNARTAPAGGVWATSGAATDFKASDNGFFTGSEEEQRVTSADAAGGRFAILGSTAFTDTEAGVQVKIAGLVPSTNFPMDVSLVARFVDASNYAVAEIDVSALNVCRFQIATVVAGSKTVLKSVAVSPTDGGTYSLRIVCFASGAVIGHFLDANGSVVQELRTTSSALATGGALASGKPGFRDYNGSAIFPTRYYDNFYVATPAAEPIIVYSGRTAEVRFDTALRQDSTGTFYGPVPNYLGDRLYVPCAGGPNRTSRVQVIAHRNDLLTSAWEPITDSTQIQIGTTSRYIAVPR